MEFHVEFHVESHPPTSHGQVSGTPSNSISERLDSFKWDQFISNQNNVTTMSYSLKYILVR